MEILSDKNFTNLLESSIYFKKLIYMEIFSDKNFNNFKKLEVLCDKISKAN